MTDIKKRENSAMSNFGVGLFVDETIWTQDLQSGICSIMLF